MKQDKNTNDEKKRLDRDGSKLIIFYNKKNTSKKIALTSISQTITAKYFRLVPLLTYPIQYP